MVIERKQYNVGMTEGELGAVERAVVGVQGGTAIRVAALSWARAMERVTCDPVADAVKGNVAEVAATRKDSLQVQDGVVQ